MKDIEDYRTNKEKRIKKEEENTMIVLNEDDAQTLSNKITMYRETLTNWIDELKEDNSLTNIDQERET